MPLFWKPYKSDVTQFIDSLKQRDPQLEERQRQGRALLWDKPLTARPSKTMPTAAWRKPPTCIRPRAEPR